MVSDYLYNSIGDEANTMTKWHDSKHFASFNNDIAIVGEEELREREDRGKQWICQYCNYTLCKLQDSEGKNVSWYRNNCRITNYETDDLRSESVLETIGEGPVSDPVVSYAPEKTIQRKKKELKWGLKALSEKGVNVTSWSESKG
jgi:hypothetical protein